MAEYAFARSSFVKFMVGKLGEAGCKVDRRFAKVHHCDEAVVGGFGPGVGVVLCHNHMGSQDEVNRALTHELIHAYDHCRGVGLDWTDCDHHACSEVRAANLSGDCHWWQEVLRGNWTIQKQHQTCVKRRAVLSVAMNPNCQCGKAEEAVERVFKQCFKDTKPFDKIP